MTFRSVAIPTALVLALAGCGGNQNTLAPASHPEHAISDLFWVMLGGSCVGFAVILTLLALGFVRRRTPTLPFGGGERAATRIVIWLGVALPIVLLIALFVYSDVFVLDSTAAPAKSSTSMSVEVIGHQWWWEVRYPGTDAVTANEIHIPTRTRVDLVATTADVIHSFWVPELNRKIDMIPGLRNRLLLETDRPGLYRGQCAEFCGLQHAHMAVAVIAQPRAEFERWLARNARPAAQGNVQFSQSCGSCHAVRGTDANGDAGPDLTHFGSRLTLAALTRPNDHENLAEWLRDPQHVKPGNRMPAVPMTNAQRDEVQRYVEALK